MITTSNGRVKRLFYIVLIMDIMITAEISLNASPPGPKLMTDTQHSTLHAQYI